jgi:hypothetical protein
MGKDDKQQYIAVIGDGEEYPEGLEVDEAGRVQNFPGGIEGYKNPNAVNPAETALERQQVFAQIQVILVQLQTAAPNDPKITDFAQQITYLESELAEEPVNAEQLKYRRKQLREKMTIAGTSIRDDDPEKGPFAQLEELIFTQLLPGEIYRSY